MSAVPVIAASEPEFGGTISAFAVAKPAEGAVWLYWLDGYRLVDEITISVGVACQTLTALAGALDTFELAETLSKPIRGHL